LQKGFDVLFVNIGTNDAQDQFWPGPEKFQEDYAWWINDIMTKVSSRDRIKAIFFGKPTPVPPKWNGKWPKDRVHGDLQAGAIAAMEAARALYPDIYVAQVDFFKELGGEGRVAGDYADSIHPNDSGYGKMANAAFRVLNNWRKTPRIVCMGDSITTGPRDADGWPEMLQSRLGDGWDIGNFGESGRTVGPGKPYTNEQTYFDAFETTFDVAIITLMTNDGNYKFWEDGRDGAFDRPVVLKAYQDMIEDLLTRAQRLSVSGLLLGVPPPITDTEYSSQWDEATVNGVLPEMVGELKAWTSAAGR